MEGTQAPVHHLFDIYFPLPYRVNCQIILGVWGWAANVHALSIAQVDMPYMLRYQKGGELHKSIYSFATTLTVVYVFSICLFWIQLQDVATLTMGQHPLSLLDLLPWGSFAFTVALLLFPRILPKLHGSGRARVARTFFRVMLGGLDNEYRLADILLADCLTSYTKSLADIGIMVCMLFSGYTCLGTPDRQCGGILMVPLISAIPFLIRLRQCITDYFRSNDKTQLFNALKYASAFPVIILSALQRHFEGDDSNDVDSFFNDTVLWRLWALAILINSTYCFIWDITFDWDLGLLQSKQALRNGGLRPVLYFSKKEWYYLAILIDYTLRFTWSLKISSHWYDVTDREGGLFILGLLEVFRRWIWIFFRVESEWVKSLRTLNHGLDELPLTETKFNANANTHPIPKTHSI